MSKVVLITPGSPATNPRLVKEADALHKAGHDVHVLYGYVVEWAESVDAEILGAANWTAELVGGSPTRDRLVFHLSTWWYRIVRRVNWAPLRRRRYDRISSSLIRRAIQLKADLYIAHNLGALAAAVVASKHNNGKSAFDAEDYHYGQYDPQSTAASLTRDIEDAWLPHCDETWAASPLISEAYRRRFTRSAFHVIDNVFPARFQRPLRLYEGGPLRLIWFSQTIGAGRGLEPLFKALTACDHLRWRLTLIGRLDSDFEAEIATFRETSSIELRVLAPMPEARLFEELADHHVGLALETGTPLNRDLCRTNKLFSFLLSGCCLLMTDTRAQSEFQGRHPETGVLLPILQPQAWGAVIADLLEDVPGLEERRRNNWSMGANQFNWDREQRKLVSIVSNLLRDRP